MWCSYLYEIYFVYLGYQALISNRLRMKEEEYCRKCNILLVVYNDFSRGKC